MTYAQPRPQLGFGLASFQPRGPFRVRRVFGHVPLEIGRLVVPPDGSALAQSDLGGLDPRAGNIQVTVPTLGIFDSPPSIHQFGNKQMTALFWDRRIRGSPQPAPYEKVSAIRCCGLIAAGHIFPTTGTSSNCVVYLGERMSNFVIQAFFCRATPAAAGKTTPRPCLCCRRLALP